MKLHTRPFIKSAIYLAALGICATAYAQTEKTLHYSTGLTRGSEVCFVGDNSNVNIVKGEGDSVTYDVTMLYKRDSKSKAEETFDNVEWTFTEGTGVCLEQKVKRHKKVKHLNIDVTVTVPDGYPLDIQTVNGNIKTRDSFQTNICTKSVNGDIEIDGDVGGSFQAHNVNGLVKAGNIGKNCNVYLVNGNIQIGSVGGNIDANNVNGQTRIGDASASVNGSTVNGNITVSLVHGSTGPVELSTVNGNLNISCPDSLPTTITAQSGNGSLSCEKTLKITKMRKGKIEGSSGDGSVNLKLKSTNGNVTIETE